MAVIIGGARHDENGNYVNGKAGDQLQNSTPDYSGEVSMCDFYVHSKGWYIIRPKSASVADKLAELMYDACDNAHIGYDQNGRYGIITYGIHTTTNTECDCSSLVRECVKEATGIDPGDFDTSGEPSALEATGLFESKFKYSSGTTLDTGDILCTCSHGHTVIVVKGTARTSSSSGSGTGGTTSGTKSSGTESPKSGPDSSISGKYTVTASTLNIRKGPGTSYGILTEVSYGTTVQNYGYYTKVDGVKWLYVVANGVEGFACGTYLSKGSTTSSTTSSTPSYTVGNTYTVQADHLAVRSGAGTNYSKKAKSQLTSDGQKNAYSDGCLKKGTKVTCKATKTVSGNVWMQIPSGWVAAYYNKNKYVK